MKRVVQMAGGVGILLLLGIPTANAVVTALDIVQAPTGYFTPSNSYRLSSPYYRWYNEDWGWAHSGTPFDGISISSATLSISAFDVDWPSGQVDNIYAYDNGTKTLLGQLSGQNNQWSYTTFTLGSQFYDDIGTGLQVEIDIDSTHTTDTWAVSLAKSVLEVNGAALPGPDPSVPDGGVTAVLLGAAMAGLGWFRRLVK